MLYADPSPKQADSDNNLLAKICQILAAGGGGGGGGAPTTASYLVLGVDATLTNERVLTGTASQVILTDNGAGSTLVLSLPQSIAAASTPTFAGLTLTGPLVGGNVAPDSASYVTLGVDATLMNERVLTGTANQVILTDNGAGSTIVLSLPQSIAIASTPTFGGLTLTGPLVGGSVAPDSASYVTLAVNATLTNERVLTGTANQVILTDNGAGSTIVLSLPQSIATASTPIFAGLTLTGALLFTADNTIDIGAAAATRPRSGFFGTSVVTPLLTISTTVKATAPADGVLLLTDNATTSFGRIQFGGTTVAFPALKRNGTGLEARLANDSAYTGFTAETLASNGAVTVGTSALVGTNLTVVGTVSTFTNGTTASPAIVFASRGANWGFCSIGGSNISVSVSGAEAARFTTSGDIFLPVQTGTLGYAGDTLMARDTTDVWAMRRAANATSLRIYSTFTSSTNFERLDIQWAASICQIWTEKGSGGGTARVLVLGADATELLRFDTGSKLSFFAAATVVKQTSGANLTNNVTAGGTTDQVDNFTDLVIYANDAAAIRNDIYQLSRKLKQVNDGLRSYGLFT